MVNVPNIKLNSGFDMPQVGFGLWKVDNAVAADCVYNAIKAGYRLFDGACDYGNEVEVGQGIARAIKDGLVKREELFVVSKLWNSFHDGDKVEPIARKQLADLGLEYFDLYLIHLCESRISEITAMDVDALLDDALEGKPITDEKLAQTLNGKEGKEVNEEKEKERERSRSRSRSRDRKKRRRSSSRDRKRSSSRDRRRKRSRSRDRRRSRSRSRDRRRRRSRSRSRDRRRSRSRDRPRVIDHRRSPPRGRSPPPRGRLPGPERRDVMPFTARQSPPKNAKMDMSAEERDFRTIFVLQIARQTRPRDLEEFFSSVGHVRDVRIITDSRTGRSKGIAYVEFWEEESVALGLALNGQRLLGAPLVIQRTCAERNRAAAASATVGASLGFGPANNKGGPVKLHISNLHPNIDEKMLESLFEGFGKVTSIKMNKDNAGNSLGIAYVTFQKSDDGHKAAEQLNGFDLAGNALNIRVIDDEAETARNRGLDNVVEEKAGVVSGQAGRVQMMQRLAQGSNMEVPEVRDPSIPSIATQCFMLSNMFDPSKETEPGWDEDVKQDVLEECTRHGGAVHIYVDKSSAQGNVYVKCSNVSAAHKSVTALHGRWFSGKVITANYVPVNSYHELFPDSMNMVHPLQGRSGPPIPPPPAGFGYPAPAMGMSGGYSYY